MSYIPDRELIPSNYCDGSSSIDDILDLTLICECCFKKTDKLYTARLPFINIIKKEYWCKDCFQFYKTL